MKLSVQGLQGGYRPGVAVFSDLDLELDGGAVGFIGRNGAGKTCAAETLAGALKSFAGEVRIGDEDVTSLSSRRRVLRGISLVPEGREIFGQLTVRENLLVAAAAANRKPTRIPELEERFPILGQRSNALGASLSGGEQQLLAIARALVQEPSVIILDEPSLGLSPIAVDRLIADLRQVLADSSVAMILMEQNAEILESLCDHVILMDRGQFVKDLDMSDAQEKKEILEAYLGA